MTTAQLFAEALTTLPVLLRAGAVWLVLLCGVAGLAVYAVVVAVWCGCRGLWQAVSERVGGALAASRALRAYRVAPERYRSATAAVLGRRLTPATGAARRAPGAEPGATEPPIDPYQK